MLLCGFLAITVAAIIIQITAILFKRSLFLSLILFVNLSKISSVIALDEASS